MILPRNLGRFQKGKYGTVAQLVEHRPFKPRVMGSIPIGPTTSNASFFKRGVCFLWVLSRFGGGWFGVIRRGVPRLMGIR